MIKKGKKFEFEFELAGGSKNRGFEKLEVHYIVLNNPFQRNGSMVYIIILPPLARICCNKNLGVQARAEKTK